MPFFSRKSRSDIGQLEKGPPKSLATLRKILTQHTKVVIENLATLEKAYYGFGKNPGNEIKKWLKPLNSVLSTFDLPELRSALLIQDVLKRGANPRSVFKVDRFCLSKMQECHLKVLEYMPGKFKPLTDEVVKILGYLEKYCLSFYDPETDPHLGTATDYTRMRGEWSKTIKKCLNNIVSASESYKSAYGVTPGLMGTYAKELGARYECSHLPFLLLFPDACENVRVACSTVNSWIKADENFVGYLKNDLADSERKLASLTKLLKQAQEKSYQASYKVHQKENQSRALENELESLKAKEDALLVEEEYLGNDTNEMQLELDIKEFRRDELRRNAAGMNTEVLNETWDQLNLELRDIYETLPAMKKRLDHVHSKLKWINERREALQNANGGINELAAETAAAEKEKTKLQSSCNNVTRTIAMIKQIVIQKTSVSVLQRIFYDLDRRGGRSKMDKEDVGPLDRAFHVVANHIGNDWMTLYRNLPFIPPRGNAQIEADIHDLSHGVPRDLTEDRALRSLQRWRRHHTRARAQDLLDTLAKIKRFDLVQDVNLELHPPTEERPTPEEYPEFMDKQLIPFYKEVERFDKLRVGNDMLKPKLTYDYCDYLV